MGNLKCRGVIFLASDALEVGDVVVSDWMQKNRCCGRCGHKAKYKIPELDPSLPGWAFRMECPRCGSSVTGWIKRIVMPENK